MSLAGPTNTSLAVVRDQELSVHEQLDIARQFGPLHKHATTLVIQETELEEVQNELDYLKTPTSDAARCPDASAFSKIEFWQ
jgi:sulfonate dioxygenase